MRKNCVRWTKSVRAAVATGVVVASTLAVTIGAQSTDPSTLPRLSAGSLTYIGGFRLPAESTNNDSFSIGGRQMTFNPAGNSLFIGSRAGRVAEVSIPSPVNSANVNALPFATFLQPFADPTEGRLSDVAPDGVSIEGLMVYGNRLHGTASIYYDANNTQRISHYSRSLQLNQPSFSGWSRVWDAGKTGFVSGYMALVPAEWRARLGGPAATGQGGIPIAWRTSWGPAAIAFDPALVGQAVVPAAPLLYYTGDHATLGPWDGSNPTYGATSNFGGMAIIAGTRTALYWGRNGTGPHCYGNGTSDQTRQGTVGTDGATWCYDPTNSDKGSHAYPYRYQVWAYDLNDLAAVRQGTKQPWDVVPYGVWPLTLPTASPTVTVGGVGYDAARQILYVSQMQADQDGYSYRPLIHAFQINAALGTEPNTVSAVQIGFDKLAPQQVNSSITATATPTGGVAPHEYRWAVSDGTTWAPATEWSAADQVSWVPTTASANYRVGVWVRSAGKTESEASSSQPYEISGASSATVSAVTLVANRVAPQPVATPITFTAATPGGGAATTQYKWLVNDGGGWTALTGWSALNAFTWTPAQANANFHIGVWARSAGSTRDEPEASAASAFAITGAVGTRVSAATVSPNRTAPQAPGAAITWTATASGGTGVLEYKWLVYDGARWAATSTWTTSNSFVWTPTIADPNYRVGVWVRTAGNSVDAEEASASMAFPITALPTAARATAVAVSANRTSPQAPGTTITWAATPSGGVAPYQYKWLIFDGARWTATGTWTSSNTFAWTPSLADPNYRVGVWVRSSGNTVDAEEVSASLPFPIAGTSSTSTPTPTPTTSRATSAMLSANRVAPQAPGTTITATATVVGGAAPFSFKWLIYDGARWTAAGDWTTSNTFSWTPTKADPNYKIGVWVRSAGNTKDELEVSATLAFPIK